MTPEEKKNLLIKMGLGEETAENYLQCESDVWAVLPAFRFLKPLSDDLDFYKGNYRKMIANQIKDGTLDKQMPEVAELVRAGASPESIEKFAYHLILSAYDGLLYQLDDHEGAEYSKVFLEDIINIGTISLVFNNDTGAFEWPDFEYGYFDIYEENSYGNVADNMQNFFKNFNL